MAIPCLLSTQPTASLATPATPKKYYLPSTDQAGIVTVTKTSDASREITVLTEGAPFVGVVEIACGGLLMRLAAIPLIIDTLVAIATTKVPRLISDGF